MWAVAHAKSPARKRGVDKEGVIGAVGPMGPMDVSEDVQQSNEVRLNPMLRVVRLVVDGVVYFKVNSGTVFGLFDETRPSLLIGCSMNL